ncbi:MAG: hypothetical protein UIM26_04105 [Longicatena sp.]|nr:hypothetical protein [Longicatena sp.]
MDNKLKKLNRRELLKILVAQQKEIESLNDQLQQCQEALNNKQIQIEKAGSLAEASLALNQVIEHAQQAADQYLLNLQTKEEEMKQKEAEVLAWCEDMKRYTKEECERMIRDYQQKMKEA